MKAPSGKAFRAAAGAGGALFAALLAAAPLLAVTLTVEPLNVADNSSSPDVRFSGVLPGQRFLRPLQYIRVSYAPVDSLNPFRILRWPRPPRFLRLYTRNPPWAGEAGQFNGLLRTDLSFRIPLFWRAFDARQLPSSVVFSTSTASQWVQVRDPADTDWNANQTLATLPMFGGGKTFIYLGADRPTYNFGPYGSALVFELFTQVADTSVPAITHVPFTLINDLIKKVYIVCDVDEDVNVADAQLNYRVSSTSAPYKTAAFAINDDFNSPFIFHLRANIPAADLVTGNLQYWFTVSDGLQESAFGTSSNPEAVVLNDVASAQMTSLAGGRLDYLDGDSSDGTASLFLPKNALRRDARVSMHRVAPSAARDLPRALPPPGSPPGAVHAPWPVMDLSSSDGGDGVLKKQALLTLVYDDLDGDGLLDGTGVDERKLRLFRYDGYEWRLVGGTVDTSLKQVQAPISAFGRYALLAESFAPPFTLKPRERILSPGRQDGMNDCAFFDGAGVGSVIRIFDVRGHLVREVRDLGLWDARNSEGVVVESGVYVYQIESNGKKTAGTITVAK